MTNVYRNKYSAPSARENRKLKQQHEVTEYKRYEIHFRVARIKNPEDAKCWRGCGLMLTGQMTLENCQN